MKQLSLNELVRDFDSNFDCRNFIQFIDPEFLKGKYGETLYNAFTNRFMEEWFTILGDAILDNGDATGLIENILEKTFKDEKINYENEEFSDYEYEDSSHPQVNKIWTNGGADVLIQEFK